MDLESLQGKCQCGQNHQLSVKKVLIEEGALSKVQGFLRDEGIWEKPVLICDTNTYNAAGKALHDLIIMGEKDLIILDPYKLHADEKGIKGITDKVKPGATVLIAIGAGTIHDLTRYVAKEFDLPFIAVPTAASVDGFVSTVAAMTINGFKLTSPAVSPLAVFADTTIFSKAPYYLSASGFADLLGKHTALLDWEISNLLTGEYICHKVVSIEKEAVEKAEESAKDIQSGHKKAYECLMEGLILSGLAMQMVGNSRPASGAEHHISHLWEMHVINEELEALHGEKVGVALGIVCDQYKKITEIENIEDYLRTYQGLPYKELQEVFKTLYPEVITENTPDVLKEINVGALVTQFGKIKTRVESLPSGNEIRQILKGVGAKTSLEEIGLDQGILEDSIAFSPFVRRRLTLMRLLKLIQI